MLEPSHSFRRQNSLATAGVTVTKTLSPEPHSSPAVLSHYRDRLPSPSPTGKTPVSQPSEVCPMDEVDTPGKQIDEDSVDDLDEEEDILDHDGSYSISSPPLPPRTTNPNAISPTSVMSPGTRLAITTPRHWGGLMLCTYVHPRPNNQVQECDHNNCSDVVLPLIIAYIPILYFDVIFRFSWREKALKS